METLKDKRTLLTLAVAAVLAIAGVAAWVHEGLAPESDMGLSSSTPWGSTMALFIVFIGLATGSLLIASCSVLFKWESLRRVCGLSAAAGLGAAVGGVFYIMSDLGTFGNILNMLTGFNVRSLLSWDMIALPLFMVACVVFLLALKFGRSMRGPAVFGVVASLFLLFVDAWIFAFMTSREAWNSSLMLPWFIVSAVSSALALTVIVAAVSGVSFSRDAKVCAGIAVLAGLDAALAVTETAIGFYHGEGSDALVSSELAFGSLAPYFWVELVASVLAIVLAVAARKSANAALPVAAAVLVVLAVCAKRLYFIASGFVVPLMPEPSAEGIMAFEAAANAAVGVTGSSVLLALGGVGILAVIFIVARAIAPAGVQDKA